MDGLSPIERAHAARRKITLSHRYNVSWRGGGDTQIVDISELKTLLRLKEQSIRSYLATGRGTFALERTNPLTCEPDLLTVERLPLPVKEKRPVGRPPKQYDLERLGTEFAPPAKTVPKTRNRRTDEKQ